MDNKLNKDSLLNITYTAKRMDLVSFKQITLETITIRKDDDTLIIKDGNGEIVFKTKCNHNEIVELFNKIFDTVKHQDNIQKSFDDYSAEIKLTYSGNKNETYDRGTCSTDGKTLEDIILDYVEGKQEC